MNEQLKKGLINSVSPKKRGFTDSQIQLIKDFTEWNKSDSMECTIAGAAGTGKTFMVKHLMNKVLTGSCTVSAPTHKAVRVVSKFTGIAGHTIHSLHGLAPSFNIDGFDINSIKFESINAVKFNKYDYIFMDECSQIGDDLYSLNKLRSKTYGTRIIYVGDHLQLPPVRHRISKTFDIDNVFYLTDIVRQSINNPMHKLLLTLRSSVININDTFLKLLGSEPIKVSDSGEGYIVANRDTFSELIVSAFKKAVETKTLEDVRYTAYTNDNIVKWNTYIRNIIMKNPKEIIQESDFLTSYKTLVNKKTKAIVIKNSDDYYVISCTKRISDLGFACYNVDLKSAYDNSISSVSIVDHTDSKFKIYVNRLIYLRNAAINSPPSKRGKAWREYYDLKESHLSMVEIEIPRNFGKPIIIDKDIDYGYGLTIHKLQGSTIKTVFVNMIDICYKDGDKSKPRKNTWYNPDAISFRNRLAYTAIGRTSFNVIILM